MSDFIPTPDNFDWLGVRGLVLTKIIRLQRFQLNKLKKNSAYYECTYLVWTLSEQAADISIKIHEIL